MTLGWFSNGLRTVPHSFKLVYGDFSRFITINESVKNEKGCLNIILLFKRQNRGKLLKPSVIACKSSCIFFNVNRVRFCNVRKVVQIEEI